MTCCKCNRTGRCLNCSCVKRGQPCLSCLPQRLGNCANTGQIRPSSQSASTDLLSTQPYPGSSMVNSVPKTPPPHPPSLTTLATPATPALAVTTDSTTSTTVGISTLAGISTYSSAREAMPLLSEASLIDQQALQALPPDSAPLTDLQAPPSFAAR